MSELFMDWFPDAPLWVPWLAFWSLVGMAVVFLAVFAASPIDAWRNRHSHEEGRERVVRLARNGLSAQSVALGAATGLPAHLFEPITSEIERVEPGKKD